MTITAQQAAAIARLPGERKPALPDLDVQSLVLNVVNQRKLSVDVREIVTNSSLRRSIEGASELTLSILDEDRELLRSGRLERAIDVQIAGEWFRYVHPSKTGDILTLELEPRGVARLRTHTKPRKISRSKLTMAQFAQGLVRAEKLYPLGFYCPELNKRQPIASLDRSQRDALRQPGIGSGVKLYGKDPSTPLTRRQLRNAETALKVGEDKDAPKLALKAALLAGIVEAPNFDNPTGGDRDSRGILQVRVSIHGVDVAKSVEKSYEKFYTEGFYGRGGAIKLARENPTKSAGWIAQQVQGSGFPDRYDVYSKQADAILDAYTGGVVDRSTYFAPYEYMVGAPDGPNGENYWDALQRLATDDDRGWRAFEVANTIFFAGEADLFRGRPRALLSEYTDGVLGIDFGANDTKVVSECVVSCYADMWAAPPGSVVLLEEMGPANGRWLVADIDRKDLFDDLTTITLRKPAEEMPEPRGETRSRATIETETVAGASIPSELAGSEVAKAYQKAVEIDRRKYDYQWGGGHGVLGEPTGGPGKGYDCSGFVSAVLGVADLGITAPLTTVGLNTWGQPGKGKYLTVWVKENGNARQSHTFLEFTINGRSEFFEAGGTRGAKTGRRSSRSTEGFQPRHWGGT